MLQWGLHGLGAACQEKKTTNRRQRLEGKRREINNITCHISARGAVFLPAFSAVRSILQD